MIISHKGYVGPIAERALRNIDSKRRHSITGADRDRRVRYFAVGHLFKHIDPSIMEMKKDEQMVSYSERLSALYKCSKRGSVTCISHVVDAIRNINSHYVHDLTKLRMDHKRLHPLRDFLIDAFTCAVEHVAGENNCEDKELVTLLSQIFIPKPDEASRTWQDLSVTERESRKSKHAEKSAAFGKLSFFEAVEAILFTEVETDIEWSIRDQDYTSAPYFTITKGSYLSFYGTLFVLSMFLYKHEAQGMISRIEIFKNSKSKVDMQRLELFTLFAKRFSSQDMDGEERYLVRFHDMISYLNRYPTPWDELLQDSSNPLSLELIRELTTYLDGKKSQYADAVKQIQAENDQAKKGYKNRDIRPCSYKTLFGRNRDRFMQFAARYFAENNTFGAETSFKCYKYYNINDIDKEEMGDHTKYHQGRPVHFITYKQHIEDNEQKYPNWDIPFVIEGDRLSIEVEMDDGRVKVFLQRDMVSFLLERALVSKDHNIKDYLTQYYTYKKQRIREVSGIMRAGNIGHIDTNVARKILPKRLVRHYCGGESHPDSPYQKLKDKAEREHLRYQNLLRDATSGGYKDDFLRKNKGKRYKFEFVRKAWHYMSFRSLYDARKESLSYVDTRVSTTDKGHHKSLHITRDQFDTFSAAMYAFSTDNPEAKQYLHTLLEEVGFMEDPLFKRVFENSTSLSNLYDRTICIYDKWLMDNRENLNLQKEPYQSNSDIALLDKENKKELYINLSDFIDWYASCILKDRCKVRYSDSTLYANRDQLIGAYYGASYWRRYQGNWKEISSREKKWHNKLERSCYEDTLLYTLAYQYRTNSKMLHPAGDIDSVETVYDSTLTLDIRNNKGDLLYKLSYPFQKLDRLVEDLSLAQKIVPNSNPKDKRIPFLDKLPGYLKSVHDDKPSHNPSKKGMPMMDAIFKVAQVANKAQEQGVVLELTHEDIFTIRKHILACAIKVSKNIMDKEKKFLIDCRDIKMKKGRIDLNQKPFCKTRSGVNIRNCSAHLGLPDTISYVGILNELLK